MHNFINLEIHQVIKRSYFQAPLLLGYASEENIYFVILVVLFDLLLICRQMVSAVYVSMGSTNLGIVTPCGFWAH